MESLISVVVPVYNVEKYVERCIDSITAQTYKNIEIIIVDDGSTDNSGHIVDEISLKDQRIKVIHQENGGLSAARNTGIDKATGEYLVFVDSDDYISCKMIEVLFNNLLSFDADISICDYYTLCEENEIGESGDNNVTIYENEDIMYRIYEDDRRTVVAWNKLYKAELFQSIRYPVGRLHEDEYVIHRILAKCCRIVFTDMKLYYYLVRNNSIMNNRSYKLMMDGLDAVCDRFLWASKYGNKRFLNGCFNVLFNEANALINYSTYVNDNKIVDESKAIISTALRSVDIKKVSKRKLFVGWLWLRNPKMSKTIRYLLHC